MEIWFWDQQIAACARCARERAARRARSCPTRRASRREEEAEDENDWLLEQIEELLAGAKAAAGA